jgi:hypothetical protein
MTSYCESSLCMKLIVTLGHRKDWRKLTAARVTDALPVTADCQHPAAIHTDCLVMTPKRANEGLTSVPWAWKTPLHGPCTGKHQRYSGFEHSLPSTYVEAQKDFGRTYKIVFRSLSNSLFTKDYNRTALNTPW